MCQQTTDEPHETGSPEHTSFSSAQYFEVQSSERRRTFITCLFLILAVLVVFGQTFSHEFLNFDDDIYVTDNPQVRAGLTASGVRWALQNLEAGFWHPLTWLSLMADAEFYGLRAGGFHVTNVLLHAVNTLLLFFLLLRLTKPANAKEPGDASEIPQAAAYWTSTAIAALFAVHPLHVESVAWVSARKDVLSTMFWMLTLLFYTRYAQGRMGGTALRRRFDYGAALIAFVCGLMSKPMLVTLPPVMLLLDYWPLRRFEAAKGVSRFRTISQLAWEKAPFFGLAIVSGLMAIRAQETVAALGDAATYPVKFRVANAAISTVRYLSQMIWPANMAVFYPYPESFPAGLVLVSVFVLVLITSAVVWLRRGHPYLIMGWCWYLVTLAPVSGLIQVGAHSRGDRYTYVPLIGIFIMVAWGLGQAFGRRRHPRVLAAAAMAVLIGLVVVANIQTRHWRDNISLWQHTLACTSENDFAHHNLGTALVQQGKLPEAIQHFGRAIQIKPDNADTHLNLGIALGNQRRLAEAIQHFERALALQPQLPQAHNNLGVALLAEGKPDQAVHHFEQALQLDPNYADSHLYLGRLLAQQGNLEPAIQHLQHALQLAARQGNRALVEDIRAQLQSMQTPPPRTKTP